MKPAPALRFGDRVLVPADPNGRIATVTGRAAPSIDRWRIDWYEPMTHSHRWAWWDGAQLEQVDPLCALCGQPEGDTEWSQFVLFRGTIAHAGCSLDIDSDMADSYLERVQS